MPSLPSAAQSGSALESAHPKMLRAELERDPERLRMESRREIGQALEWALDQVRMEKKAAAADMGYTNQSVIGEWIAGTERVQLDKLRVHCRKAYVEFLLALLQMEEGVEVKTQVTMRRVV